MIPYATLFNMLRYAEIKRYDGIWQDWLCMQIEKDEEIEPWMMCLAENPIEYDTIFNTRIEKEWVVIADSNDEHPPAFAAGFAWKMYKEGKLTAPEIVTAIDRYDELLGCHLRAYIMSNEDDDDYLHMKQSLENNLEDPMKFFEEKLWNLLPQDTRDLFVK